MKQLVFKEDDVTGFCVSFGNGRGNNVRTYFPYGRSLEYMKALCESYSKEFEIDLYIIEHWDEFVEKYNNFLVKRML